MANLKFYRGLEAKVANAVEGAIWFNTADKTINVKTSEGWEKYAGNLKDASWNTAKSTLTISKNDGSSIDLDFSDMASATNVANVLGSFADAAKNDNTASIHARINKAFSDIKDLSDNKLNASDETVKSVDESDTNGLGLRLNDGKLSFHVAAADSIVSGNNALATADAVYSAIENKISGLDKTDAAVANQYVSAVSEADGIVSVTRADLPVHSVDTTADHGVNLSLSAGKIDVTVTPGSVADSNDSVVTGGAVYSAIQDEVTKLGSAAYTESSAYATAAQGSLAASSLQSLTVSNSDDSKKYVEIGNTNVTSDPKNPALYLTPHVATVESDTVGLADAKDVKSYVDSAVGAVLGEDNVEGMTVYGLDKRLDAVETLLAEDGDDVINNLKDVIDYFNGVKEEETGAALLETVSTLDAATINGKKINESPVLSGADVKITGYAKGTASDLAATDTINAALGKLEARVDAAAAGGVQSFGGQTGSITVKGGQTVNGSVNLTMSDKELQASIVGLGSAAFTDSSAYATAAQGSLAATAYQLPKNGIPASDIAEGTINYDNLNESLKTAIQEASDSVQGIDSANLNYLTVSPDADRINMLSLTVCTDLTNATTALADARAVKTYVDNKVHDTLTWAEF